MDSQKPWLADFIKSSLDAWFGELEGCRSADYQFQKIDDNLKASHTAPCQKTVYLLKLPKLGLAEAPGEIFDGIHKIETIFTNGTAQKVIASGARHGTLLHLVDPVLRVTPHVNPPKPLVEVTACETVDETDQMERNLSGCAVSENQDIRERMFRYWAVKRHNRAPSTSASRGSPDSFRSQVDFSTQAFDEAVNSDGEPGEDNEEEISQQAFLTQVPDGLSRPRDTEESHGSPARIPSNQTQQPATKGGLLLSSAEVITSHNESSLPPTTTAGEQLGHTTHSRLSLSAVPSLSPLQAPPAATTDNDKSSPVEISELSVNIPESPKPSADHSHEEPPSVSPKASPVKQVSVHQSSEERPNHFQLWRREKHRYLPRRLQEIPKKQGKLLASLLDSGDSWQPSLVGRTQRPGEIPLDLLVELSDAADKRASDAAWSPNVVEPKISREAVSPAQHGQDQELKSAHPSEGDTSDSEESVDWSQSPPTQERRANRLPPNSPPPTLTRRKRSSVVGDSGGKEGSTMSSRRDTTLGSSTVQERKFDVQSLSRDHSPSHLDAASSTTDVPHAELDDKKSSQDDTSSRVAEVSGGSGPKKIQVSRTPYGGKGSKLPQTLASRITPTITKSANDDGNLTSTFVPGTYFEPSSGDIAVTERSLKAFSANESSNPTPESLTATSCEPQILDAMELEDANPGKTSTAVHSADLGHALSTSGGLPSKVQALPDQRNVLGCSPDSRRRQSETVGTGRVDAEAGAGGRHSNIAEEINLGSFKKAAPGPNDKVHVHSLSETRVLISVSAKRKPTSPGKSNIPLKRPRQEQIGTGTDAQIIEIDNEAQEYRGHQLRQTGGLEDPTSAKSPPRTETDHSDEDQKGQHHPEIPRSIGNPSASAHHSCPSSRVDNDSSSGPLAPLPNHGRRQRQPGFATNVPRQSSTSITRPSVYGGADAEEAQVMADGSHEADNLFARYRAAYPDYEGSADDFLNSYCFVKEIWIREPWPKSIHPSHLDDAVFHHFHSYRPYTRTVGTASVGFVEFFHAFIEDPNHHERIIRPSALENAPGRGGTVRRSTLGDHPTNQGAHFSATAPVASTKIAKPTTWQETVAEHQLQFKQLAETRGQAVEDRIDSIERWREDTARTGSPELGTSDVDRGLSRRKTPTRESPEPATRTSRPRESREPSAGPFIKPPKPATASTRRSSSVWVKKRASMRNFWSGTSTAFTTFERQYAKLVAEKKGRALSETPGPSSRR
ncbi:hypothetical protein AYL99_04561 [Fonsecaea erecta]|uniref:Uncharacterized protein n=1 Tax=Fonsecaea erecta TaxID=1367422 RepID=A0A178ZR91_9EURO|nr:hypothetical protein AYL99_04561 [Fonsecaea erecta]OAP62358.1 hypothetical protein AYL99_04561 [Fonsecaea erecta]